MDALTIWLTRPEYTFHEAICLTLGCIPAPVDQFLPAKVDEYRALEGFVRQAVFSDVLLSPDDVVTVLGEYRCGEEIWETDEPLQIHLSNALPEAVALEHNSISRGNWIKWLKQRDLDASAFSLLENDYEVQLSEQAKQIENLTSQLAEAHTKIESMQQGLKQPGTRAT